MKNGIILPYKVLSAFFKRTTSSHDEDFYCFNCFLKNLKFMKMYVKIMVIVL